MNLTLSQSSTAYAASVSAWLFALSRPTQDAGDVTAYWCGWIVHPADGRVALTGIDTPAPIHPDADPDALVAGIAGAITTDEAATLRAQIEAARGTRVAPADLLPASLGDQLRTEAELRADGWFADPEQ